MHNERELRELAEGYTKEANESRETGRMEKAISLYNMAVHIYEELEDLESTANTYSIISVLYKRMGQVDLAIDIMLKALDLAFQNRLEYVGLKILNNIGDIFVEYNNYEKALDLFLKVENILKESKTVQREANYNTYCVVCFMNITQCYIEMSDFKKAETYLRKSWEQVAYLGDESYAAAVRLAECRIHFAKGDREFLNKHLDDIINEFLSDDHTSDMDEKTRYLVSMVKQMNDFDRWKKIIQAYEKYSDAQDDAYFYMRSADLWADYYQASEDEARYASANAEYRKFSTKYYHGLVEKAAQALDARVQLQIQHSREEQDYLMGQRDFLTGVGNEEKLRKDFSVLMKELADTEVNVGVGIIDVDGFAKYNKTRGYLGGDELLKRIGGLINDNVHEHGVVYRIGGDSFILLLTDCTEERIKEFAERMLNVIPVPASQGYMFTNCDNRLGLDGYLEKAERALSVAKSRGGNQYSIIDSNIKNYHEFYRRYRSNMEESSVLENSYRNANDKTEWLLNLSQRRMRNQELYSENERLITRFITPLLDGTEPLTDEIAVALAEEIWDMRNEGLVENFIMLEVAEFIEEYLSQSKHTEEHMHMLITLGEGYHKFNVESYRRKGRAYYQKLNVYENHLPSVEQMSMRRTLFEAFLKASICYAEDATTTLKKNLTHIHHALEYYERPEIKGALRYNKTEIEELLDEYIVLALGCSLIYVHEVNREDVDYKDAYTLVHEIYERAVEKVGNCLEINDRLHAVHERLRWLLGEITLEDCYYSHKAFFQNCDRQSELVELSTALNTTVGFRMMVYYIPELFLMNSMASVEFQMKEQEFLDNMLETYMVYTNSLPKGNKEAGLTLELYRSFSRMLRYLPEWVDVMELVFRVLIERNVDNSIHSRMVAEISKLILECVYRENPKLFIGSFGFETDDDVYNGFELLSKYIEGAGLIHDIGKIETNDIVNQQIRKISDMEFDLIKRHPISGVKMVENSVALQSYIPVIAGHHKYYDDTQGYPDNYKYTEHDMKLLVNIIQIADSIDAATDHIGRTYARPKSLHEVHMEFDREKGTRYSAELIDLMERDEIFADKLLYLITDGREDICYEVFKNMSNIKGEES